MGYTHYWYRPPLIDTDVFHNIKTDFEKLILPLSDIGVPLASWDGQNEPELTNHGIRFNGVCKCGHPENEEIFIPYPAEHARGIGSSETAIIGSWYNLGVELRHRCCGGRCCHEPFSFPKQSDSRRRMSTEEETAGLVFDWTKTAFKPYDVAVTSALLIAKRFLRNKLVVHSNGLDDQWADGKDLCEQHVGYGAWFGIVEDPRIEIWPGVDGQKEEREVRVRLLVEMDPAGF